MHIHSSPFARDLLTHAVDLLAPQPAAQAHPLQSRWVIQPGRLWEQALRRALADRGMAANLQFGSLRLTLERACRVWHAPVPLMTEEMLFRIVWRLLATNENEWDRIGLDHASPPRQWLRARGEDPSLDRLQLAQILRTVLDDHATHRPAEVLRWLDGACPATGDARWIARLARAVWDDPATPRPLALHLPGVIAQLHQHTEPRPECPAAIVAVLTGAQPAVYLHALGALARLTDVHLLVLATCERGLSDQTTTWRDVRHAWRQSGTDESLASFLETQQWWLPGSLQACWGQAGITLQQQLIDLETALADHTIAVTETATHHQPRGDHSALHILQDDIVHSRPVRTLAERAQPAQRASLRLLNAPAPLRELEGARDMIRHALQTDPTLEPSDILMILTDVEQYAPLLPAVFGAHTLSTHAPAPDQWPSIPWHLADRSLRIDNEHIAALMQLIELFQDRLTLPRLADCLNQPAIAQHLDLSRQDVQDIVAALDAAYFRWGWDRADRRSVDQPGQDDGRWTLDFALQRLATGFALPDAATDPVGVADGVTPLAWFEGLRAAPLARFMDWVHTAQAAQAAFVTDKPLTDTTDQTSAWTDWLLEWMPRLMATETTHANGAIWLQRIAARLADNDGIAAAPPTPTCSPRAFTWLLKEWVSEFEQTLPIGRGRGGMTIASPRMARALPARMLVVVGLSDGVWPRPDTTRPRGLLAQPAPGDRIRREDDKLTALEWICSARDQLVCTWTGRNPHRGEAVPPSVVIGELKDILDTTFSDPHFEETAQLHAFHPAHFGDRQPHASYDQIAAQAAQRLQQGPDPQIRDKHWTARPINAANLRLPDIEQFARDSTIPAHWTSATWPELAGVLVNFWHSPCRAYLRAAGIGQDNAYRLLPDREALEWDGLDQWFVRDQVLSTLLNTPEPDTALAALRRRLERAGHWLPGPAGLAAFEKVRTEVDQSIATATDTRDNHAPHAIIERLAAVDWQHGAVPRVWLYPGQIGAKQKLQAMIDQACLTCAAHEPVTVWLTGKSSKPDTLPPLTVEIATQRLQRWTRLALLGTAFPLPFFPAISEEYAGKQDLARCREQFEEGTYGGREPEQQSPAVRLAFRHLSPLDLHWPSNISAQPGLAEWAQHCGLTANEPLFTQLATILFPPGADT